MKNANYILVVLMTGLMIACSDNAFKSLPTATCDQANASSNQACIPGSTTNTYSISFHTGDVDILVVNDNSGSMYVEQSKMAQRFPNFISSLSNLYFQIAMITTDVSSSTNGPRAANGNGAFQDGKFLPFSSTEKILKFDPMAANASANLSIINSKFADTVQRDETLACGDADYAPASCPSGDERGIYALNLAAARNEGTFFRNGAHLAVIILSDEDERSNGGAYSGVNDLESKDLAETFLSNMQIKYPTKTISVHSVIIRPNDSACLSAQSQGSVRGFYGYSYAELSRPDYYGRPDLMNFSNLKYEYGHVGSICDTDYGAQLGSIGNAVAAAAEQPEFQLKCSPNANEISITTTPSNYTLNYTIDASNKMIFSNVPAGVNAKITYKCPSTI